MRSIHIGTAPLSPGQLSDRSPDLKAAMSVDMNFPGSTREFTHAIHSFAARFPPRLPRHFIRELSRPGETVLDPMMGSGTTILEAALSGRVGVGFDIDPLAVLISEVKTTPCDPAVVEKAGAAVLLSALARFQTLSADDRLRSELLAEYDDRAIEFFDYWFKPTTVTELLAILGEVRKVRHVEVRQALLLAFSSIIITKSAGVTLSRDLAHTRPHKVKGKEPGSAFDLFPKSVRKLVVGLVGLTEEIRRDGMWTPPKVQRGDSRRLPLPDSSVDLVVTSPPYATALDYMRANKFTLSWLGYEMDYLTRLRSKYIGTETAGGGDASLVPPLPSLVELLSKIAEKDGARSRMIGAYFSSMLRCYSEMFRVMRPGAHGIVVVGPSTFKGIEIPTHTILAEEAALAGFRVEPVKEREIDRNGRQMPTSFFSARNGIEARIHTEFIIGFVKPSIA
jgi:DNA modification methylase